MPCRPKTKIESDQYSKGVQYHIRRVKDLLKIALERDQWSVTYNSVIDSSIAFAASKSGFLALRLQSVGVPIHALLDRIPLPDHRAAVSSFLCDWFIAKHAHN